MPQNLPINLNNSSFSKPQVSAHAQNFATTQLQQKKDIVGAKISMDRVIKSSSSKGPLSSISRIGQNNKSTSVSHGSGNAEESDENVRDEIRDRLRFQHIRQMMKDKKNNPDDKI
ncbi:MAG: hypothetical protein WC070_03805 [Candidatus Magasanikbacteria bacterium]